MVQARLTRAWLAMLEHVRELNSVKSIAARLTLGSHEPLVGVERAAGAFAAAVHAAYIVSGQGVARWLSEQVTKSATPSVTVEKKVIAFDVAEPRAVKWAAQNALDKIREISTDQRDAIREILVAGARSGVGPADMARQIRGSIGLTAHQTAIVENYRRELEAGQYAAALARELSSGHSDRAIAAAARTGTRLTAPQIDTMVERYRANWVGYRAEAIARTEGLRVAHQGNDEAIRQAVTGGDIEPGQIERKWIHSHRAKNKKDERTFHVSMHNQVRPHGVPFTSGLGHALMYPGDPTAGPEETLHCRCVVSTRLLPPGRTATAQGGPVAPAPPPPRPAGPSDGAAAREAAAHQAAAQAARAELEAEQRRIADELAAAERAAQQEAAARVDDGGGFRIGISEIGGGADDADAVEPTAAIPNRAPWATADELALRTAAAEEPYRTPTPPPPVAPSRKPAPAGFEAIEHAGKTYYRHVINGRSYDATTMTERARPNYAIELTGPNVKIDGYETLEVKTPKMPLGEIRYRSRVSGTTYTAEMLANGEAAVYEEFLAHPPEAKKKGLLGRIFRSVWPEIRGIGL